MRPTPFLLLAATAWATPGRAQTANAAASPAAPSAPGAEAKTADANATTVGLGVRVDCLHDFTVNPGATQPCLEVSGLRLDVRHALSPKSQAMLRLDPFGSPSPAYAHKPRFPGEERPGPKDTGLGIVDAFQVAWRFRSNLTMSLETFEGTTSVPDMSGLAFGNALDLAPWKQTALVARYALPPLNGIEVTLAVGNGEGEPVRNLDPQQYGGVRLDVGLAPGFKLMGGFSFDGNDVGSESYEWLYGRSWGATAARPRVGFSTDRYAAALVMDGTWPQARGLTLGLSWQRVRRTDLDKEKPAVPTGFFDENARRWDVGDLAVESPTGKDAVVTEANHVDIAMAYRILAAYSVGFSYESRRVTTGKTDFFQTCREIAGPTCRDGAQRNKLDQSAYSMGVGADLDEALRLVLEYHVSSYDKLYALFHYPGRNDMGSRSREAFNARLTYNW